MTKKKNSLFRRAFLVFITVLLVAITVVPKSRVSLAAWDDNDSIDKTAFVDGDEDKGTAAAPVPVVIGDEITYSVDIFNSGALKTCLNPNGLFTKFETLSNTGPHTLAIDFAGNVWAWGFNQYGGLGDGTDGVGNNRNYPYNLSAIPGYFDGRKIVKVYAKMHNSSFAIDEFGDLWTWGLNSHGQLADGLGGAGVSDLTRRLVPYNVSADRNLFDGNKIVQISEGAHSTFMFAIDEFDNIWAWGRNEFGIFGNGTSSPTAVVTPINISTGGVLDGIKITQLSHGFNHVMALDDQGRVWTWGHNRYPIGSMYNTGALGTGDLLPRLVPTLISDGVNFGGKRITAISSGWEHCVALDEDGNIWTWGYNDSGQLGNGGSPMVVMTPTKIYDCSLPGKPPIIAISNTSQTGPTSGTGYDYGDANAALDENGDVWTWGGNWAGELGQGLSMTDRLLVPTKITGEFNGKKIDSIFNGWYCMFAIDEVGNTWGWGTGAEGAIGIGSYAYMFNTPKLLNANFFTISDLLPAGLSLVTTVTDYVIVDSFGNDISAAVDVIDVRITTEGSRQRITFDFMNVPSGLVRFQFVAKVEAPGLFVNTADFKDDEQGFEATTTATYHQTQVVPTVTITNRWRSIDNLAQILLPDETVDFPLNGVYTNSIRTIPNYTYVGWFLDGEVTMRQLSDLPSEAAQLALLTSGHTVTYVYMYNNNPNTGDNGPSTLIIGLLALASLSLVLVFKPRKKSKA